jgi:hypothetical protein
MQTALRTNLFTTKKVVRSVYCIERVAQIVTIIVLL